LSFKRTLEELKKKAVLHWSKELMASAGGESILDGLLGTQDEFLSVLKVASLRPLSWETILNESASLSLPLFTKHLMILCDLGGETLNKLTPLEQYFPNQKLQIPWGGKVEEYAFQEIHRTKSLTNDRLKLTHKTIFRNNYSKPLLTDLVMILLYGYIDVNDLLPNDYREKCSIGSMLGEPELIDKYVKENYVRVSSQLKGATANSLGHFAQEYVLGLLKKFLPDDWSVVAETSLTGVTHNEGGNDTNFDLVALSPKGIEFGIEVSFQVTTNSTIERKARESSAVLERVHKQGHFVCYVLDGAGNINIRKNAVNTICSNSDCTVALSEEEIEHLSKFLVVNG